MNPRFSLGIDLGTSNCAMAVADNDSDSSDVLPVTQIVAANQVGEMRTLPSALYLPHPEEFPAGSFRLPWEAAGPGIVGQFARDHGALVPDRLVTSAKSWLSNPHIDPKQRTLPWRSDIAEEKLSPFECSSRYLQHLKVSFLHSMHQQGREWDLADGQVVLTVPASFDEVARSLTAEAAEAAGLGKVVLLEEPQAAFYAWTAQAGRQWRNAIAPGDIILVCDIGGGTADFSLIAVTDVAGDMQLERISVGEHILLGGDNMDLALAYTLRAKLEAEGKSLDSWQLRALVHAASQAKIALFEDATLAEAPIAVPSRGSSLFAKMVSTALDRATLSQVVLDGFLAQTAIDELPQEARRAGLQEFGLPYASDPVVSKHLARFLTRSLQNVKASDKLAALVGDRTGTQALIPTAVLFNGGVFKAAPIRARVLELLASWNGGQAVCELEGFQPDLAVAQGAAVYGRHRATGKGHAHQGRRGALVLCRPREFDAGGSRLPPASKSAVRRAARDGGRNRASDRRTRVRPDDWPGGRLPLLLLGRAQRRHARTDRARRRAAAGRDKSAGSGASPATGYAGRSGRAGADRVRRYRAWHARTLDEARQLRPQVED